MPDTATARTLSSGQNIPLPTTSLTVAVLGVGRTEFDVCALLVGSAGVVEHDSDLVFFNAPAHPSGAVSLLTTTTERTGVLVHLERLPARTARLVVTVSVDTGLLGVAHGLSVTVGVTGQPEPVATFTPDSLSAVSAAVLIEIYRRGSGWKLRAVGQGWDSGLAGLLPAFGVAVDDDPRPGGPEPGQDSMPPARIPVPAGQVCGQAGSGRPPGNSPLPLRRPDWYDDPGRPGVRRWWSGTQWSADVFDPRGFAPNTCGACGSKLKRRVFRQSTPAACAQCENELARVMEEWRAAADHVLRGYGPRSSQFDSLWTALRFHRVAESNGRDALVPLAHAHLDRLVSMAFADGIIEDSELAAFDADVVALGLSWEQVGAQRAKLVRGRQLTCFRDGALPTAVTSLHLDTDEVVHLEVAAQHVRYLARGPARTAGRLIVTSKKLRFVSVVGGTELPWSKVVDTVPQQGQVEILASSSRGGGVYEVSDPAWVEAIIAGAVRVSKRLVLDPSRRDSRSVPQGMKAAVWQRDGGRCVECGSGEYLEYDHDIPYSRGGATSVANLRLLCRRCNARKGNRI